MPTTRCEGKQFGLVYPKPDFTPKRWDNLSDDDSDILVFDDVAEQFDPNKTYRLRLEPISGEGQKQFVWRTVFDAARARGNLAGRAITELMLTQEQAIDPGWRKYRLYQLGTTWGRNEYNIALQSLEWHNKWSSSFCYMSLEQQSNCHDLQDMIIHVCPNLPEEFVEATKAIINKPRGLPLPDGFTVWEVMQGLLFDHDILSKIQDLYGTPHVLCESSDESSAGGRPY